MDLQKKYLILGLTLLAFCELSATMGLCRFARTFPNQGKTPCSKKDTSKEDKVCQTWTVWGSSCYLYNSTSKLSRDDAAEQCSAYHDNTHLVFIESSEENDFVVQLVGSGKLPWIGLRDIGGEWVWSSQGTAVDATLTYTAWIDNHTTLREADEDCAFLSTLNDINKWQAYQCYDEDVFVCELER